MSTGFRAGATALHALIPVSGPGTRVVSRDALEERLATSLGDNEEVVVVREARVAVALTPGDCRLGSSVANRVSTAAAESITAILKAPKDADKVARFENQTAFAGAFIVDLLASRAWDRWCYGPFRRYRRATMLETIAAVLDENDRVGILRWLRSHGHDDACAILESDARLTDREGGVMGPARECQWRSGAGGCGPWDPGWTEWPGNVAALHHAVNALIARREIPAWTDAGQLSTWVIDLVSAVLDGAAVGWAPDAASLIDSTPFWRQVWTGWTSRSCAARLSARGRARTAERSHTRRAPSKTYRADGFGRRRPRRLDATHSRGIGVALPGQWS